MYKFINSLPVELEDLRLVDKMLYESYSKLLKDKIEEDLGLTFELDVDELGCDVLG